MSQQLQGQASAVFLKPILPLLSDSSITEIMINGASDIYIERSGKIKKTDITFPDEKSLEAAANRICQSVGKRLTWEVPRVDARLEDGSRVHIVCPPVSRSGVCISIRRFPDKPLRGEDLLKFGSVTRQVLDFLSVCVEFHLNIMVAGGTGSGKTSLLNVLSAYMPEEERILVIEDTSELQVHQPHVVRLEARTPDEKGRGEVPIRALFHSALRMRPDRVIIGEIRAGEALDLVQAMTSGHSGSLSTVHATTPLDALCRLETLCLYAESGLPLTAIRNQVSSALNLVVQTARLRDGSRKVTEIAEVMTLNSTGAYETTPLYQFETEGIEDDGKIIGCIKATGNKPSFYEDAKRQGYPLTEELFRP